MAVRFLPLLTRRFACFIIFAALAPGAAQLPPIRDYIKQTWTTLTRSNRTLAAAAVDPKFQPESNGRWPVYIPADEDLPRISADLRKQMPAGDFTWLDVRLF